MLRPGEREATEGTGAVAESETKTEQVYRRLRSLILSGRVQPGAQLQFAWLKEQQGASFGVLREALTRLSAEGLVVNQAQYGFRVMSLSSNDLADLTEARCLIESLVLKDSVTHGDLEWEGRILAAHHRMERTPKHVDDDPRQVSEAWERAHHDFHTALLSAARSRRLQAIAANLRASAEVYRRWSMPFEQPKRDVSAEHMELLNLSLARDAQGAAASLTRHLSRTKDLILGGIGEEGVDRPEGRDRMLNAVQR